MTGEAHVVLGAGQVGRKLAVELLDMGHAVRLVRRGEPGADRPNLTWMRGDITDRAFVDEACAGAAVVYQCTNPPEYQHWEGVLEPLVRGALGGAARAGARLVVLDNLYMVGRPPTVPFDEDAPLAPCSRKGELRAKLFRELMEAHQRGIVRFTSGRAADYFGPRSPNTALFGARFFTRLSQGKPAEVFGNPDLPRSYSYTPDVARGLAVLGTRPEAMERRAWHLPVAWQGTTRELVERFYAVRGQVARLRVIPPWAIAALGVVSPLARAAREMMYQWEIPYVVDDRRFRSTFGVEPTDIDAAVKATVSGSAAARGTESPRRSRPSWVTRFLHG